MKSIKLIYFLISATIVLILANSVIFLNQFYHNQNNYASVKKAYTVIEYTNQLQSMLLNAEAGQRGFYINADSSYLKPYHFANANIKSTYKKLYALETDHPSQLSRLRKLDSLITLKLAAIKKGVWYQTIGNREQAYYVLKSSEGNNRTEQIVVLINQIKSEENASLEIKNAAIDYLGGRIQLFSVISNWILLVIVVSALINIIRNRQQIETLFSQIGKKNELLENQKTELQTLSQNLIRQNTELERFAYVASHDLRSPAVNQKALLGLYEVAKDDEERAELFLNMKEVAHSLSVKLDDLVEALRSNLNSNELNENLNFEEVCHKVVSSLAGDILESKAHIECDFSEAPDIYFPKSYLESILQNLISNAIKYRHPERNAEIKLKSYLSDRYICFKISDNGLGIDLKKYGDKLFGLYKTFHKGHNSKGLGLYITKAQVLAMGGTIDVNSAPDVGTTFSICLKKQQA